MALRRSSGPPPHVSFWAWCLDGVIAAVLSAATVYTAANPADPTAGAAPLEPLAPAPPPLPDPGMAGAPGSGALDLWAPGDPPVALLILAGLCVAPVVLRRRFPLSAFVGVLVLTMTFHARYDTGVSPDDTALFTFIACVLTAYSALRFGRHRAASWLGVGIGAVAIAAWYEVNVPAVAPVYVPLVLVLAAALAVNAVRGWRLQWRALQARRQDDLAHAVEVERSRIARELHDVVTHHVSVMLIQTGAARTVLESDPARARAALQAAESSGREAMAELRTVVGLLADGADGDGADGDGDAAAVAGSAEDELRPQPGLDRLEALIDRVRAAGVEVGLEVTGVRAPLPAGADLAAHRVVQEALTNVMKHAAGASATVRIEYRDEAVAIEVRNQAAPAAAAASATRGLPGTASAGSALPDTAWAGSGRGLIGLRERLAAHGGTLSVGPDGTGFRVLATIPVPRP